MTRSTVAAPARTAVTLTWWRAIVVAAAAAAGGGLLEFVAHETGRHLAGRNSLFNTQMLWLAPLANLLVTVPLMLLTAAIMRRWKRAAALPVALGVAVTLAILPTGLLFRPHLHFIAITLLAMGIGAVAARLAASRPPVIWQVTQLTTVTLVAAVVLGGIAVDFRQIRAESAALRALPPAAGDAPNVLLLVLDTVRGMSLSVNGYARRTTPRLERFAADGIRFTRAVSTAPWTLPSHASMFTGLYPHELSAGWGEPLDREHPVLAERFAARGYMTGGFIANLLYCNTTYGLDRGFQLYRDYLASAKEAVRASNLTRAIAEEAIAKVTGSSYLAGRPTARDVVDEFLRWEPGARARKRPFFAFLNFFDAHGPYTPPAPYDTMYLGRQPRLREPGLTDHEYTASEISDLHDAYEGAVTYLDAELGRLFDELKRRGVLDHTIVIVTSDHGEEFSEHGILGHGDGLHFPALHVPLIIRYPRTVPRGATVDSPVTLRDLAATILDLAGVPPAQRLPGRSLALWWYGDPAGDTPDSPLLSEVRYAKNLPPSRPVSKGDMYSLVDFGLHFIHRGDNWEEMYDITRDPLEQTDFARQSDRRARVDDIRAKLRALVSLETARR